MLVGLVRIARKSKECFRKLQMRSKVVGFFKEVEEISFRWDQRMKKGVSFLVKRRWREMETKRREKCFSKIKSAAVLPLALTGRV